MSIRKVNFVPEEYYHIYNRGNSKREIFHNQGDHNRFLQLLYLSNSETSLRSNRIKMPYSVERDGQLVSIGAYCLMPNHFHLLIKQPEKGDISKFMHKLLTAYSMYYNIKHKRIGSLFEGKFRSEHIDNDRYLKYIFSYIHLNPVKLINSKWKEEGIVDIKKTIDFLEHYQFSSYLDYLQKRRPEEAILDKKSFPNYFQTKIKFKTEIFDWLKFIPE